MSHTDTKTPAADVETLTDAENKPAIHASHRGHVTFYGIFGSASMPVSARDEKHAAEVFARMRMTPDRIGTNRDGTTTPTRIPSRAPRQPPRIDLPVLPPDDERAAVATILAAIETEHIDPRDVYRALRPVLARLGKDAARRTEDASYTDRETDAYARGLRQAARVLERTLPRASWGRAVDGGLDDEARRVALFDGETGQREWSGSLHDYITGNEHLATGDDPEELAAIRALSVGDELRLGGGAQPLFVLRRIS